MTMQSSRIWLLLVSLLVVSVDPSTTTTATTTTCTLPDDEKEVLYEFVKEAKNNKTFVDFTDPLTQRSMHLNVPSHFPRLSSSRVSNELSYFLDHFEIWSERVVLEIFYYSIQPLSQQCNQCGVCNSLSNWLREDISICEWEGVTCGSLDVPHEDVPSDSVTRIDLMESGLHGTLPTELACLSNLQHLNLNDNSLQGNIPSDYGLFPRLMFMDLGDNKMTGTLPPELGILASSIEELWLEKNAFSGTIPRAMLGLPNLRFLDLSNNKLTGPLPSDIELLSSLGSLFLEENQLTSTIPTTLGLMSMLKVIDLGVNDFTGQIPSQVGLLHNLIDFNVASNRLSGSIPMEFWTLSQLEVVVLSENDFSGRLPDGDDVPPSRVKKYATSTADEGFRWSDFTDLVAFAIDRNNLVGTFPPSFFYGLAPSLTSLDIGFNFFTGTFPPEVGKMTNLKRLIAPFNVFEGQMPFELGRMKDLTFLNLTSNTFTGTIPKALCGEPFVDPAIADRFGCETVMCPPGTFHPDGAASLMGGCQPCPKTKLAEEFTPPLSTVLGRSSCESSTFLYGDLDADGQISPYEALRLLYFDTGGQNWGSKFQATWGDLKTPECDLMGITCTNGKVTKIDLTDATLCSEAKVKELSECNGLPSELMHLSDSLEALWIPHRRTLKGPIPSEIGHLTKLEFLILQSNEQMSGTLPSELGNLTNLKHLDISGAAFNGTIPSELFRLTNLEKLNLTITELSGSIPTEVGNLKNAEEIRLSRAKLNGTIPTEFGRLSKLENFEIYTNFLSGSIPEELTKCTALKRIDIFNNKLTGTIPNAIENLRQLQILHFKTNELTGTLPPNLEYPYLVWFDVSLNQLSGTIPPSLGDSRMLKDLRLHGNRFYDAVPENLCTHANVNAGRTAQYGCDAIVCPRGSYAEQGYVTEFGPCNKCPPEQTSMYLGSTGCIRLTQSDMLAMLYDVLDGDKWPDEFREGWKEENTSVCEWAGVTCDEERKVIGLSFPTPHGHD